MEEYKNSDFAPENQVPADDNGNTFVPADCETCAEAPAEETVTETAAENAPAVSELPPYTPPYNPVNVPEVQSFSAPPRPPVDPSLRSNGTMPPPPVAPREMNARPTPPPPHRPPMNGQTPPASPAPPVHSGEYRYVPPYAGIGANQVKSSTEATPPVHPEHNFVPAPEPEKKKKEKVKTVRTFSTTALVFILIGAVVLSFASGMLGALFIEGGLDFAEPTEHKESVDNNDKENSDFVINKADDDEEESDGSDSVSSTFEGSYDLTDVCAVVSASVVEISTEFNQTYYGYYQYVQEGAGSGVIISEDGYIITNAHVITNTENGKLADAIKIRLNSGDEYSAKIIGSDSDSDIALLKINAKNLSAATVGNSDKIEVGEQVIAVGNPLGELGGTVTSGIVSATNREISVENNKMTLIQIDAAINPGNSGGGLFNTDGELIGIVNAKTTDVTVEGLGFAIPVNEAVNVAEELESHGYVTGKTYIGISLTDVTDAYSAYYYFRSDSTGVYVTNVLEGYNDDVLKYGDRITAINDNEVTSSADVKEAVTSAKVGDKLSFTISREGKLMTVEVTCYEYVPENGVSFDE